MGFFGPKNVTCPAGQWTTIISNAFVQFPATFTVHFEGEVAGELEETKSSWIFPGSPRRGQLTARMTFRRGYWNTFYRVRVHPTTNVVAVID